MLVRLASCPAAKESVAAAALAALALPLLPQPDAPQKAQPRAVPSAHLSEILCWFAPQLVAALQRRGLVSAADKLLRRSAGSVLVIFAAATSAAVRVYRQAPDRVTAVLETLFPTAPLAVQYVVSLKVTVFYDVDTSCCFIWLLFATWIDYVACVQHCASGCRSFIDQGCSEHLPAYAKTLYVVVTSTMAAYGMFTLQKSACYRFWPDPA